MMLEEYGAWFRASAETMPCPPGVDRWNVIKQRVAEIDGCPTTQATFLARYRWRISPTIEAGAFDSLTAMEALGRAEASAVAAPD